MKPFTPEQQTFAESYASKQDITLDAITPEQRNKLLTAYRADKKRKADKTNNTATVSIALNQQAYEVLSTTAKAKGLTLSQCIIEQFAKRYDVTPKQSETKRYDVTPTPQPIQNSSVVDYVSDGRCTIRTNKHTRCKKPDFNNSGYCKQHYKAR
jgi:hypothetical protein